MAKGRSLIFTSAQQEFMDLHHRGITSRALAERLNTEFGTAFSVRQIQSYKHNHGLRSGVVTVFRPGNEPHNKGKKWGEVMSPESQAASRKTTFKKGQISLNHKPVGTEAVRRGKARNNNTWVWVKIAEPNKWREKHRLVYEQAHGPIPRGHVVIFADGNRLNTDLSNLILISRSRHATVNRYIKRGRNPEATRSALLTADLLHRITRLKKAAS